MFILIVVVHASTYAHSSSIVSMQEFQGKDACTHVGRIVEAEARNSDNGVFWICEPKSRFDAEPVQP